MPINFRGRKRAPTKREREQAKAQASLMRAGELPVPEDYVLDPVEERNGPCSTHPGWIPARRLAGQPNAPAGLCPFCEDERRKQRRYTGARLSDGLVSRYNPALPLGMQKERALESLEAYEERFRADGKVVPGSPEEDAALARIDAAREKELEELERKKNPPPLWPPLTGGYRSGPPVTRIVYPSEAT
jgi:hypothetical protein